MFSVVNFMNVVLIKFFFWKSQKFLSVCVYIVKIKLRKCSLECKSSVYYCIVNKGNGFRVTAMVCSVEFQINVRVKVTLCVNVSLNCILSSNTVPLCFLWLHHQNRDKTGGVRTQVMICRCWCFRADQRGCLRLSCRWVRYHQAPHSASSPRHLQQPLRIYMRQT